VVTGVRFVGVRAEAPELVVGVECEAMGLYGSRCCRIWFIVAFGYCL